MSLLVSLKERSIRDDVAIGILKKVVDVSFVYLAHMLADALEPIARLNVKHQSPLALIFELSYDYDRALDELQAFQVEYCG